MHVINNMKTEERLQFRCHWWFGGAIASQMVYENFLGTWDFKLPHIPYKTQPQYLKLIQQ